MFFSIIIPVYNVEEYLRDCLDSCLEQDISDDDYELICVNDGSTDSCLEILMEYVGKYSQVKVFSQENRGLSAARNTGLDHSGGDYIIFLDSDDLIRKNCLKSLKDVIVRTGSSRLKSNAYIGDSKTAALFRKDPSVQNVFTLYPYEMMWMSIYKRSVIEDNSLRFLESLTYYEDLLFLRDYQNVCFDIAEYPEPVYFYRQRPGSLMDEGRNKRLKDKIRSFIKISDNCSERILLPENNKNLYYQLWKK